MSLRKFTPFLIALFMFLAALFITSCTKKQGACNLPVPKQEIAAMVNCKVIKKDEIRQIVKKEILNLRVSLKNPDYLRTLQELSKPHQGNSLLGLMQRWQGMEVQKKIKELLEASKNKAVAQKVFSKMEISLYKVTLNEKIDKIIQLQEAKKLGIIATEDDVQKYYETERGNLSDTEFLKFYKQAIKNPKFKIEDIKNDIRRGSSVIIIQKLKEKIKSEEKVDTSPKFVKNYLKKHSDVFSKKATKEENLSLAKEVMVNDKEEVYQQWLQRVKNKADIIYY